MATTERRFRLREGTAAAHAALDATVGPLADLAAYRRYLTGLYAGRAPVEQALAGHDTGPEPLAALMAQDIDDLNLARPSLEPFVIDHEPSSLLGVCYVLEGAALGARLLLPQAIGLGLTATHGARHLDRQARSAGFREFLDVLEHADPYDADRAAASASATFAFIQAAMKRAAHDAG